MSPLYCTKGHENPSGSRFCQYCGEKLQMPMGNISQGMILGDRYRIVRELGHGGFGRTYLSEDLNRFNEPCVLKEFAPQVQGSYALQKAEELFEREAGVLYKLQHYQIPRFRELFRVTHPNGMGRLFLVQDYVEGYTYRALINARRNKGMRFDEGEVILILQQILPVLQYIHSLGVIHRDISPDNIILRTTDQLPVLIDFGGVKQVAAVVESQFNQVPGAAETIPIPTRLGKVGYAPDEQMQRGIVSPSSDLYALAATVLVLLTGKEPQQLIEPETLKWNWRSEVNLSQSFAQVLDRMLSHRPGDRYQSAQEVLQALIFKPLVLPVYPQPEPTSANVATVGTVATVATQPVAPLLPTPPTPQASISQSQPSVINLFVKILIVLLVIFGAGGLGWLGGNLWIEFQSRGKSKPFETPANFPGSSPTPTVDPPDNNSPQFSAEEQQRKTVLRQRRTQLGINSDFYLNLVNQAFWAKNPDRQGQLLGSGPEDRQLREKWDRTAAELLDKIEKANLSRSALQRLGSYGISDRNRQKIQVNKLRLSSRALSELTDAKYLFLFSDYSAKQLNLSFDQFLTQPIGQIWHAIAADRVKALQSGSALEILSFDPGAVNKQTSGTLEPGHGKAFIAQLNKDQLMEVQLKTDEQAVFSIYSPTGKTKILERSKEHNWSGSLPESGYYEFVIVPNPSKSHNYQLNLTVNNPAAPATPEPTPSATVSPEPTPTPTVSPTESPQ